MIKNKEIMEHELVLYLFAGSINKEKKKELGACVYHLTPERCSFNLEPSSRLLLPFERGMFPESAVVYVKMTTLPFILYIFVLLSVAGERRLKDRFIPGYRKLTHQRALSTCRKLPSELATIIDVETLKKLRKQNLVPHPATNDSYLIGMFLKTQLTAEITEWEFADGVAMEMSEFPLWAEGYPKERAGVCAKLEPMSDFLVANSECFRKTYFICQMYTDKKGNCLSGYHKYDKFCFNVSYQKMDFWQARNFCKRNDGWLAAIQDKETHEAALNEISLSIIGDGLWIGAKKVGRKWMYPDGTLLPTNSKVWANGEPNPAASKKCAKLSLRAYRLMAQQCDSKLGYLCEQMVPGNFEKYNFIQYKAKNDNNAISKYNIV
ncbi:macrophage mannose receptor 1-like [Centruroides vittatus]|uniref:macrophage mannose receptor 1-like n=1 Tax=Centruroides vittatus TaxID=120091 RepID=UPI003510A104